MDQNKQQNSVPADPQVAPVEGQKVQYVITQRSLNGLGGWLLFFLIVFALIGLGEISFFFNLLGSGVKTVSDTMTVVFSPLLAVGFLVTVVLLALRKKLAVLAVFVTLAISALDSVIAQLVAPAKGSSAATLAGGVIASLVFYGLLALYFKQSRRVKETLVK